MTQNQQKNNKTHKTENHKTDSLFTEWPAPSDTVEGFGGNPDKVKQTQWSQEKNP